MPGGEPHRDEHPKQWRPSAKFFESNPRSASIREAAIRAVRGYEKLIEHPDELDSHQRDLLSAEVDLARTELAEMGVQPDINAGLSEKAYQSDPVLTAEYCAGQLLLVSSPRELVATETINPIAGEFGEKKNERTYELDNKNLPQRVKKFMFDRWVVKNMNSFFAIPREAPKPDTMADIE